LVKARKKREIIRTLLKKGFTQSKKTHHEYYVLLDENGGQTAVNIYISHGSGGNVIGKKIYGKILTQMHLSTRDGERYFSCDIDHKEYLEILREKGII